MIPWSSPEKRPPVRNPVRWARDGVYLDDGVRLILNYGHDYAGEILCPESCTDSGMIRYTCRDCDRDGCGYEADRAGHAYGAWRTIVEPTCRGFGKQEHSCEVCGHTESDDINKLPHDTYETVETTLKPVSGGTVYEHALVERCRNCDYSQKLGENCVSVHDTLHFRNEVPATCTEPGLTMGWECAFPGCDNSCHDRQQKPIPALGHDFLDGWCTRCGAQSASEGLEFTRSGDRTYYTVTGIGSCTDTELVIPGTHQGLPVREIGDYAFSGCSGLESITIPEGVTAIGVAAFSHCSDLALLLAVWTMSIADILKMGQHEIRRIDVGKCLRRRHDGMPAAGSGAIFAVSV